MSGLRVNSKVRNLGLSLVRLSKAVEKRDLFPDFQVDIIIKRFELVYEQFIKTMKTILEANDVFPKFPKEVMREALKAGWISDEQLWFDILTDRNICVHVYSEEQMREIYQKIINIYYKEFLRLHEVLKPYRKEGI